MVISEFWRSPKSDFSASKFSGLYILNDNSVEDHKCVFIRSMIHALMVGGSYCKCGKTARGHRTSQGHTVLSTASLARHGSSLMGRRYHCCARSTFSILDTVAIISGLSGKMCDDYIFHKSCLSDAKKADQYTHSAFDITGVITILWYLNCFACVLSWNLKFFAGGLIHYQDSLYYQSSNSYVNMDYAFGHPFLC